jgi:hypothetical protein
MTIGIAAFGPEAGRAILAGLAAAERIGRGAIGGFVSFAALCADGRLERTETQRGGSGGLKAVSERMLAAPVAALMSSAANRPEPLAQFVAGAEGVGLVTGHRFPNMPGRSGLALNQDVLARMAAGARPKAAVAVAVSENSEADAGLIAVSADGRLGSADTKRLDRLADRNHSRLGSQRRGGFVAVRHNGIQPARGLALVVAELALSVIRRETEPDQWIELHAGVPIRPAAMDRIVIDDFGYAKWLEVSGVIGEGIRHLGMGSEVPVFDSRHCVGLTTYEPFLTVSGGLLVSIDGETKSRMPVRLPRPCGNCTQTLMGIPG